jgi:hypothetical protein
MSAELGRGESPGVRTRVVVSIVVGILVVLIAVAAGFQLVFRDRVGQTYAVRHPFPAPAVVPDERAERLALQAKQRHDLNGAHGRLPIDAAMKAIAAKGDRAFDPVGRAP